MASNLLSINLKETDHLSIAGAIREYIRNVLGQRVDKYNHDLEELDRLRMEATDNESNKKGLLGAMKLYYEQLSFLGHKFPTDIGIEFPWYPWTGNFRQVSISLENLQYERAAILFNIGALLSEEGVGGDRTSGDGLKNVSKQFQIAAGCMMQVSEEVLPLIFDKIPDDISQNLCDALQNLLLAQAQECFWQKAVLDKLKDTTIARLSCQVSLFYSVALDFLIKSAIVPNEWIHHVTVKKHHFSAAAQYRMSVTALEASKYGEEISRLREAKRICENGLGSARWMGGSLLHDVQSLHKVIVYSLERAEKDNDLIYLERVPKLDQLAQIPGASMVKPVVLDEIKNPIENLQKSNVKPLFEDLIPFAIHQAADVYANRRDSLVENNLVNHANNIVNEINLKLQQYNLPGKLLAEERSIGLPQSTINQVEDIKLRNGISRIHNMQADVANLSQSVELTFKQASGILENIKPAENDDQYDELYETMDRFSALLRTSKAGDEQVAAKVEHWEPMIRMLGGDIDIIEKYIPSANLASGNPAMSPLFSELKRLYERLEILKNELENKVESLRLYANEDDATEALTSEYRKMESEKGKYLEIDAASFEDFFARRLSLYNWFQTLLENTNSQVEELMQKLESANRDYDQMWQEMSASPERIEALQQLSIAYQKFREIHSNLEEGRTFYNNLSKMVSNFQDKVRQYAHSRVQHAEFNGANVPDLTNVTIG